MHTILLTYADDNMQMAQAVCGITAKNIGITTQFHFGPNDFDKSFGDFNQQTLNRRQRGGGKGFWLFKPYFCYQVVANSQPGDFVVYSDAGVAFLEPLTPIFELMNERCESVFLFGNEHRHLDWCKREVAQSILMCSKEQLLEKYKEKRSVQASVVIFRVSPFSYDLCKRWLAWSQVPGFIEDNSPYEQLPEYAAHRNDQSILSCLALQDGIPLHWWPTQYGYAIKSSYPSDNYRQLFYHHRYRDDDFRAVGHSIDSFVRLMSPQVLKSPK